MEAASHTTAPPTSLGAEGTHRSPTRGGCVDCIRTGSVIEVPNIEATRATWPAFAATAGRAGLGAICAIPITVRDRTISGVNVFLAQPGHLSVAAVSVILAMTQVIAKLLEQRYEADEKTALAEQLTHALESRVVIEQAKGYLAYRHGTDVSLPRSPGCALTHAVPAAPCETSLRQSSTEPCRCDAARLLRPGGQSWVLSHSSGSTASLTAKLAGPPETWTARRPSM